MGSSISHILVSLKIRNFRLYFTGMCVSLVGTWMQQIAMSWLVYELTGSVLLLATITFVAQIPILIATPFMSVFVDRFDRHKILLFTQSLSALQALLLAWLTLSGQVQVWHLIALSLFIGLINALDNPTRQAFYPSLVPKENLSNAIALNSAVINGSRLFGPAIGGVLIGLVGEGLCFLLNGISYLGVIIALLAMQLPAHKTKSEKQHIWHDLQEGFHYVSRHIPIRTLLMLMSVISFSDCPDDVPSGLRKRHTERRQPIVRYPALLYRHRFFQCGNLLSRPKKRYRISQSHYVCRLDFRYHPLVTLFYRHPMAGGSRLYSGRLLHHYHRSFYQHAPPDPVG